MSGFSRLMGLSRFAPLTSAVSRSLSSRVPAASLDPNALLDSSLHAPPILEPSDRPKANAPPVEAPARPLESSALVSRSPPQAQLVPYGHKFVPVLDKHLTGMLEGTIAHTVIPKGTRLAQLQVPGGPQGEWYSPNPEQKAEKSGISPFGMMRVFEMGPGTPLPPIPLPGGQGVMLPGAESWVPARKRAMMFEALTDVPAVSSVARPIVDTWSLAGIPVPTAGGGQQQLSPFKSRFRAVSEESAAQSEHWPTVKAPGDQGK